MPGFVNPPIPPWPSNSSSSYWPSCWCGGSSRVSDESAAPPWAARTLGRKRFRRCSKSATFGSSSPGSARDRKANAANQPDDHGHPCRVRFRRSGTQPRKWASSRPISASLTSPDNSLASVASSGQLNGWSMMSPDETAPNSPRDCIPARDFCQQLRYFFPGKLQSFEQAVQFPSQPPQHARLSQIHGIDGQPQFRGDLLGRVTLRHERQKACQVVASNSVCIRSMARATNCCRYSSSSKPAGSSGAAASPGIASRLCTPAGVRPPLRGPPVIERHRLSQARKLFVRSYSNSGSFCTRTSSTS